MHALIQENPHAHGGKPGAARIECLAWLLEKWRGPWFPRAAVAGVARNPGCRIYRRVPEYVELMRYRWR